jgi:cysteine desulfuration protein SufE
MAASLQEKEKQLISEFSRIRNAQERLALLVARARMQPPLPPDEKTGESRVEGCLSNLWFVPKVRDGRCFFEADSDSSIVRGIAGLLCELFSGHAPAEILAHDTHLLQQTGLDRHITPNRRNGLGRLLEKIRRFASEHAAQK